MRSSRRAWLAQSAACFALALASRAHAETATYLYDELGRLVRVTYSDGTIVVYRYDDAGNRTHVYRTDGSTFSATLQVTGSGPVDLRRIADDNGYSGATNATITFQVGSGVTLLGGAGGGLCIDTGEWPTDKTIALTLQVSGKIYGGGGTGARGAGMSDVGAPGNGGDAIYCRHNLSVTVNAGGEVRAGGGGGGGGGAWHREVIIEGIPTWVAYNGGGGGGGFPNGPGGPKGDINEEWGIGDVASNGANGTTSGAGAGGSGGAAGAGRSTGAGGAGGGAAATGSNGVAASGSENASWVKRPIGGGGAPGYAIRKNGKTVTVTNNGTISGTVG